MKYAFLFFVLMLFSRVSFAEADRLALAELLVLPDKHLGEKVYVYGYFTSGIGARLFLSKEHASAGDIASSVVVVDKSPNGEIMKCREKPVYVEGVFERYKHQYSLSEVSRIVAVDGSLCYSPE